MCTSNFWSGATNAITGIATAYMDSVPLVIFSGQVMSDLIGRMLFKSVILGGNISSCSETQFLVKHAQELPEIIKKAFYIASSGRPGPVVIDVPKDVLNPANKFPYIYPQEVNMRSYNPKVQGHKGQIKGFKGFIGC